MTADRRVICAECSETLDGDGAVAQPGGPGGTGPPRNWVHKKIPGCAVKLNTQNCA